MKYFMLAFLLVPLSTPAQDHGKWAIAHWTAAAFDYSTTGLATRECVDRYTTQYGTCGEMDPLARPFIGRYPQPWRLGLGWAAESVAVSYIPNRKVRRVLQVALIVSHVACGARNLKLWH